MIFIVTDSKSINGVCHCCSNESNEMFNDGG